MAVFTHDCNDCILVCQAGIVKHGELKHYDIYVHPNDVDPKYDSIIARSGEGDEEFLVSSPTLDVIELALDGLMQGAWAEYRGIHSVEDKVILKGRKDVNIEYSKY